MLNEKSPNGTLAGAWLIQARRFAARSSTRQTTRLNSDKKVNSKPSEMGRSPLTRLANRPIILRTAAYFESYSFYIFRVFFCSVLFRAAFLRRPFLLPKIHFAAIMQSFSVFTKTIVNGNFPLKLHFEPFTLFSWSVVRCNRIKKRQEIFQTGKKLSGLNYRIPIVFWERRFVGTKNFSTMKKKSLKNFFKQEKNLPIWVLEYRL